MRMFNGRSNALKLSAKVLTDDKELRSRAKTSTLAVGTSFIINSFTCSPVDKFLTPITTWMPRSARTLLVSAPIPLEAPEIYF